MLGLPQLEILPTLVERLKAMPVVTSIYLAGSLGRGGGDLYSDVDLQVGVDNSWSGFFSDEELALIVGAPPLALQRKMYGSTEWMHHMILDQGIFLDLLCRTEILERETERWVRLDQDPKGFSLDGVRVLATPWQPVEVSVENVIELVEGFWIIMHKHRRGFAREQELLVWVGVNISMAALMRLRFLALTDRDCGNLSRMGIYQLTGVCEWLKEHGGAEQFERRWTWGLNPNWTEAISQQMAEGEECCRRLQRAWDLPERMQILSDRVRHDWNLFLQTL